MQSLVRAVVQPDMLPEAHSLAARFAPMYTGHPFSVACFALFFVFFSSFWKMKSNTYLLSMAACCKSCTDNESLQKEAQSGTTWTARGTAILLECRLEVDSHLCPACRGAVSLGTIAAECSSCAILARISSELRICAFWLISVTRHLGR